MKKFIIFLALLVSGSAFSQELESPAIGAKAKDFTLKSIQGDDIQLSTIYKDNPVVLVVLRGWPGYQCPVCTRQVGQLISAEDKFTELGAVILMVYPGPSVELQEHVNEFTEDFNFPDNFYFTIDPDYSMVNKYGIRWEKERETAYPSTFIINKEGEIVFLKISDSHGGRTNNEEIIEVLEKL